MDPLSAQVILQLWTAASVIEREEVWYTDPTAYPKNKAAFLVLTLYSRKLYPLTGTAWALLETPQAQADTRYSQVWQSQFL